MMRRITSFFLAALYTLTMASSAVADVSVTYLYPDASGTAVAGADEQGNLLWRRTYLPFGGEATLTGDADSHSLAAEVLRGTPTTAEAVSSTWAPGTTTLSFTCSTDATRRPSSRRSRSPTTDTRMRTKTRIDLWIRTAKPSSWQPSPSLASP